MSGRSTSNMTNGILRSGEHEGTITSMVPANKAALASGREVRREPRGAVRGRGGLTWDDGIASRRIPVEVRDISENGVQVIAPKPITVGVSAYLTGEEFRCIGTVRYCKSEGRGFLVGLEFNREPHYKNAVAT